jgi:HlyD family secretion protein
MIIIIVVLVLVVGGALAAFGRGTGGAAQVEPTPLPAVQESGDVVADAVVVPIQQADLRFEARGAVAEILVAEGETVTKNTPLARLDSRELALNVAQAEAQLAQAQANYDDLVAGATPEEIAQAEAQLTQAQAQLRQVGGSVTAQDVTAAQAQLNEARVALAELENGPDVTDVQSVQAKLDQAQVGLQSRRDELSAAKTNAELALQQSAGALQQAQATYAQAKSNWEFAQETGKDPQNPVRGVDAQGKEVANKVNNAQRESYYAQFVQAEAALRNAEAAVQQAQVAFDNARQAEVSGIASAEAQVRDTQAVRDDVISGATPDQLAAARARVAQAQANLTQLQGEGRAGSVEAAQAAVAVAEAGLARISADPRSSKLAVAQAQIKAAEVTLDQAQLALDKATLTAPFDGSVVEINLDIGELPGEELPAIVLADTSAWEIETDDLTEIDVVKVRAGAPATITFDALPGVELPGLIKDIQGIGKNKDGDIVYKVTVTPQEWDERLRWRMTAAVMIKDEG